YYLRACREAGITPHPARYPVKLPEFFIKFLTDEGDVVLDPFAGSNVTGEACEMSSRNWLAFEIVEEYVRASHFRFVNIQKRLLSETPIGYAQTE
ncbi:MAG: site-specific DNA-methyltransferase, partial [Nitrososphaera sp.]|nr:site-specific DNA-methyltransferase [Nitrososphaera sp.]